MRTWIRNTAFSLANFRICELRIGKPQIFSDLRINLYKFADMRFSVWHTSEICIFVIAEWVQEFAELRTKKNLHAHLCLKAIRHRYRCSAYAKTKSYMWLWTFLLEDRIPHLLVKVNVVAELFQHLPEVHPLHLRTVDRKPNRRAKMTHKIRKKLRVSCLKCWMFSFESWRLLL
jgi:hypothetical protein